MNFVLELVAHTTSLINVFWFVFQKQRRPVVKGLLFTKNDFDMTRFSYDGVIFHNQADAKNGHYYTTLAKIDDAPLAVGGTGPAIKKAEILDIASNTWTEIAEYPYHD